MRHVVLGIAFCFVTSMGNAAHVHDFIRGDFDDSGTVAWADSTAILNWYLLGQGSPTCIQAGDADGDGQVDTSDAIYIQTFALLGGPPPVSPWPNCGEGDHDGLSCDSTSCP